MEHRRSEKCNEAGSRGCLAHYDVYLTENVLTEEWQPDGFYAAHVLASQGPLGRPKGGLSCFIKAWLSPFESIHKDYNILVIRTKPTTLICAYFQPEYTEDFIIDKIGSALRKVDKQEALILAGDLNCRIDKPHGKTTAIVSFLEEGLTLVNRQVMDTYVSHNGKSVIDMVFCNMKDMNIAYQRTLFCTATAPIRKHIKVQSSR
jgi:hypothetical protein